jgi:hypothetical protein
MGTMHEFRAPPNAAPTHPSSSVRTTVLVDNLHAKSFAVPLGFFWQSFRRVKKHAARAKE